MFKYTSLIILALLCAAAVAAESRHSNALNEDCPELFLEEEMVQGPSMTQDDFDSKVVLLLFYQRECDGCERLAMPRLQELYEKYAHKPCVLVAAVNTAFDKEDYPYLADVEQTRAHLKRMEWTMPVFRDLDEKSNALFTIDDIAGTPQAVVLDVDGTVRAHDWFSEEEEMDRVQDAFERLAGRLNCDCIPMPRDVTDSCKRAREAIKEGEYSKAYDLAETICDSYGYTEEDKNDAEYLRDFVKDIAQDRVDRTRENFEYDPETAIDRADALVKEFEGVAGVKDLKEEVEKWRASDKLKDFKSLKKDFETVNGRIGDEPAKLKADDREAIAEELEAIRKRAGDNLIADRARDRLKAIGHKTEATLESSDRDNSAKDESSRTGIKRESKPSSGDSASGLSRGGADRARSSKSSGESSKSGISRDGGSSNVRSHRSHR